ncbi:MAG: hypothetical protein JO364_09250 [Pseudonocardiales bacterium]|nr:hypothetical protein [Pseudonocardiales bacterium]MBV9030482.1 hypothetical protein [Pseudonocardiales bacterium]
MSVGHEAVVGHQAVDAVTAVSSPRTYDRLRVLHIRQELAELVNTWVWDHHRHDPLPPCHGGTA